MKFLAFLGGVIVGVLLWWGLCFIPAVATFDENSHQQIIEWATPADEEPGTEEPGTDEDSTEPGTDDEQGSIDNEGTIENEGDITVSGSI